MCISEICGCFTLKTSLKLVGIINQNKMSNNYETVRDTQNMSMKHDKEPGVALSDSAKKPVRNAP